MISIHLANTPTGEYDVKLPLPKPLHCSDELSSVGKITRKGPEYKDYLQVVGFVEDIEEFTFTYEFEDILEEHVEEFVGLFPVVVMTGGVFSTLTVPVTRISFS